MKTLINLHIWQRLEACFIKIGTKAYKFQSKKKKKKKEKSINYQDVYICKQIHVFAVNHYLYKTDIIKLLNQ